MIERIKMKTIGGSKSLFDGAPCFQQPLYSNDLSTMPNPNTSNLHEVSVFESLYSSFDEEFPSYKKKLLNDADEGVKKVRSRGSILILNIEPQDTVMEWLAQDISVRPSSSTRNLRKKMFNKKTTFDSPIQEASNPNGVKEAISPVDAMI